MILYITDRNIRVDNADNQISYNSDYIAEFRFDDEWDGKVKTARFVQNGEHFDVVLVDDRCEIPPLKTGFVRVGVFTDSMTSTYADVYFKTSIKDGSGNPTEPPEDVYAQLTALIESGMLKGEDGLTPYVGSNNNWWIGDVDTGILARGTDGYTPVKGVDYFTESEIQQIQNEVSSGAIGDFKTVVDSETNKFDTNADIKLAAYNQNDVTKTEAYNSNAQTKLAAYNSNADNRVAEFNAQTEQIQTDISGLKSDLDELIIKEEPINILNPDARVKGWVNPDGSSGGATSSTISNVTLEVKGGDVLRAYIWSTSKYVENKIRFVCAYVNDSAVSSLGSSSEIYSYTVPETVTKVTLSLVNQIQLVTKNLSTPPSEYIEYSDKASIQLNPDMISDVIERVEKVERNTTENIRKISETEYTKIDGEINANGQVISGNYWHSSPIKLNNKETVHLVTKYRAPMAIIETDADGSFYRPIIKGNSTKDYRYTANHNCYISIEDISGQTPETLEIITPSDIVADSEFYTDNAISEIKKENSYDFLDGIYDSEDTSNINNAIFEQHKMIAEAKSLSDDDVLTSGICGYFEDENGNITDGTITWKLFNTGLLYIEGYGKFYDFIKGVSGCRTIAEVNSLVSSLGTGKDYWYYGFIEPNKNGIVSPVDKTEYKYETNDVITYSEKRYMTNCENINPINGLPYGYAAPWYIYRNEVSFGMGRFLDDENYAYESKYTRENPNGWRYNRVCINENLNNGGITYIGDWAFYRCCVDSLVLPTQVTKIGCWGIRYSPVMRTLVMYDNVNEIEDHGVSRHITLETLRNSNSLTTAKYGCFSQNKNLKHLEFTNLESFEPYLVNDNPRLEKLVLGGAIEIKNNFATGCYALKRLTLPNTITAIGCNAFASCTSLESIVIPSNVTDIETNAFASCVIDTVTIDSPSILSSVSSFTDFGQIFNSSKEIKVPNDATLSTWFKISFERIGEDNNYHIYSKSVIN